MMDTVFTERDDREELTCDEALQKFSRSNVAMVLTNADLEDCPIVYVNEAFTKLTGYSRDMAIGRNCRFLQGPKTETRKKARMQAAIESGEDVALEVINYRADGTEFRNSLLITPIHEEDDRHCYYLGLLREQSEEERRLNGEETDAILHELQHRVKNHLSMIVGMIRIQARNSDAGADFSAISRRIESLQLLYEEMTASEGRRSGDVIDLGAYLGRIANTIGHLDGRPGVRVNIEVSPMQVSTENAMRIGLVISEVLTNALQHAFDGRDSGGVELRVMPMGDGGLRAMVTDDGIGLPADSLWPDKSGLGGRIVRALVDGLEGTLVVSRGAVGTVVSLDVPEARLNF